MRRNRVVPTVALELELNQAIHRNRDRALTFHEDAELADISRDHGGKTGRAALILPGQTGGERNVATVTGALCSVGHASICIQALRPALALATPERGSAVFI